jgi:hypothetical protein
MLCPARPLRREARLRGGDAGQQGGKFLTAQPPDGVLRAQIGAADFGDLRAPRRPPQGMRRSSI